MLLRLPKACFRIDPVPIHASPCADAKRLLHSSALAEPVNNDILLIEVMDTALIPQRASVDAKRLRCSATPDDPVSKVLDDENTSSWLVPTPVPALDDEELLQEILIRLPPQPSSLPRASLVCTRWRTILSDPQFLSRYRKHHRKPPLLGFFTENSTRTKIDFVPVVDTKPNRIPAERFAVPKSSSPIDFWEFLGCHHGLVVLIHGCGRKVVVWDPLTGQQHRVPFPPGLQEDKRQIYWVWHATVLCADAEVS